MSNRTITAADDILPTVTPAGIILTRAPAPPEHPVLIPAAYWAILHIVNANGA
jgi:hypothetical protein